jgi:Transposase DDE domain group 1
LQTFETEVLTEEKNFTGLARLNRALLGRAEAMDSTCRAVLDMDSTEIPVYGEQEQSAYNGYFESTCYHPLLLSAQEICKLLTYMHSDRNSFANISI